MSPPRPAVASRRRSSRAHLGSSDTLVLTLAPGKPAGTGTRPASGYALTVEIDGRLRSRCYSIVSLGTNAGGLVELGIRREGLVSGHLHDLAAKGELAGTQVGLSPAQGEYVLPAGDAPLVLISAGSGVTGTIAILRHALAAGRQCTVVHYTRTPGDVPFIGELRAAGARIVDTSTEGRVDALGALLRPAMSSSVVLVVCSPTSARAGPACSPPRSSPRPSWSAGTGPRGTVSFTHVDGTTTPVADDGTALLDQAEKAGAHPRVRLPPGRLPDLRRHAHLRLGPGGRSAGHGPGRPLSRSARPSPSAT